VVDYAKDTTECAVGPIPGSTTQRALQVGRKKTAPRSNSIAKKRAGHPQGVRLDTQGEALDDSARTPPVGCLRHWSLLSL